MYKVLSLCFSLCSFFFETMHSIYSFLLFGTLYTAVLSRPTEEVVNEVMCLDSVYDFSENKSGAHRWTPCEWTSQDIMQNHQRSSFLRFPTSNQQIKKPTASTPLDISFNCLHSDLEICGKAERAFKKVGKMISDVILFKEPVRVNATLTSFCETANECGEHMMTLGGSSPARSMPLLNSDGVLRLHPQALVKQFGLPDHPAFSPFDILSVFNADAPFWFEVSERFSWPINACANIDHVFHIRRMEYLSVQIKQTFRSLFL